MSNKISFEDLSLINSGLEAIEIQLSLHPTEEHCNEMPCDFISNTDGTLRWIWSSSSKKATFLKFYHEGSYKSKAIGLLIRTCYFLGLGRLIINGSCKLYINKRGLALLNGFNSWALFTGTVGENRKLVTWYERGDKSYFAKIPVTFQAACNIANEPLAQGMGTTVNIVRPEMQLSSSILIQSDIYTDRKIVAPQSIQDLPVGVVIGWCKTGLQLGKAHMVHNWDVITTTTDFSDLGSCRYSPVLTKRLNQLTATVNNNDLVHLAYSHGDFTSWNMKGDATKIFVVDWELNASNRPALYDVFHFIYQQAILINRTSFSEIRKEISSYFAGSDWTTFIKENGIDIALCEKLYLISVVNYYLDAYSRQEKWHTQVDWLLQTWCEAMGYWLQVEDLLKPRQIVLEDIVHYLRNTEYAVLKLGDNDLAQLPETSDIDMCINKKDAAALLAYLQTHSLVSYLQTASQTFMNQTTIFVNDGNMIHLDCIWKIRRKATVFLSLNDVLSTSRVNSFGITIPSAANDVKYVWLFHLLNNAKTPERYISSFGANPEYNKAIGKITTAFNLRLAFFGEPDLMEKTSVMQIICSGNENRGINKVKNRIGYIIDKLKALKVKKGHLITFSGVDGAGKSTIIDIISKKIEKELRMPVVLLRHRPSILPILSAWKYGKKEAESRSVGRLPRTGNNKAGISSYLRFTYYYLDYLLGQFYVQLRYVRRGYIVLYDRYYFDFINDSKRSNIIVPTSFASYLYKLLIKPEFNYFLYAPADVILARKQELNAESIEMLTQKYLTLFTSLQQKDKENTYCAISNIHLESTLNIIFGNIKQTKLCNQ